MADFEIQGANKLAAVAKALKQAGDKELQKELYAGLNRATKPLKADARAAALRELPKRGGLAQRVAKARLSTRRRGGRDPGVRIVATGMRQLDQMDQGRVKHPVYGHRDRWATQRIPTGWFTDSMKAGAPQVRRELVKTLDELAGKLARKY